MNLLIYELLVESEMKAAHQTEHARRLSEVKRALASRKTRRRWSLRPFCGRVLIRLGTRLAGLPQATVPIIRAPASAD